MKVFIVALVAFKPALCCEEYLFLHLQSMLDDGKGIHFKGKQDMKM